MTKHLQVMLNNVPVGIIHRLAHEKYFFAFDDSYLASPRPPILSQSFFNHQGGLLSETSVTQTVLPSFFSNLLPEGHLRRYIANSYGLQQLNELQLIGLLGLVQPSTSASAKCTTRRCN